MKKILTLKNLIILLICIFSIIILTKNVEASTTGLTATSTQIKTGEKVTVTATVTSGAWNLSLSGAGQTKGLVGQTNITDNSSSSTSISFTPTVAGEYKFTLTGDVTDYVTDITDTVNKSITITVKAPVVETPKEPEKPITPTTPTTPSTPPTTDTPPVTATKSSEAKLKNFGIRPNDFSGFKKDKTEYSTTVPNSVTEVEVYAETVDSKATVTGTGKVTLKEGDNTVKVTITAEDGKTTKTYTLTIKRKTVAEENAENGEARLKSLGIKPEEYNFEGFDSEKTEYNAEVPYEVDEIEVYATAKNSNAQITGTGMITLEEGLNELEIGVISADGTKKIYKLNVTRKKASESIGSTTDSFGLSILTIQGLDLNPKFDPKTYEYKLDLKEDLSSLEIGTRPTDDDAKVEIIGNENLQEGENVITILVTDKDSKKVATYQIIVNKSLTAEETVKMSWLKPSTWGKEEIIKIIIIVVLIVLIISAVILKIKISKENDSVKKVDLPGAEELDKAIAEHQELTEGENYIEDIAKNKFETEDFSETPKRKGRHF